MLFTGATVMFIHDCTDITVDLLKAFNYLKWEQGTVGVPGTEIMYVLNLIMWLVGRLYVFPVLVIYPILTLPLLQDIYTTIRWPFIPSLKLLLCVLFVLHVYWFYLFVKVGYRLITAVSAHEAGDEVYEGDSDDDE